MSLKIWSNINKAFKETFTAQTLFRMFGKDVLVLASAILLYFAILQTGDVYLFLIGPISHALVFYGICLLISIKVPTF